MEHATGRSKGYGLVVFESIDDAEEAIRQLNDTELKGRQIQVREDRDAPPHVASRASRELRGSNVFSGNNRVYVGNLSYDVTWQDLKDLMRTRGGTVLSADIPSGPDGRSKGFGLVIFGSASDALEAIRGFTGVEFRGRSLNLREDRDGPPAQGGFNGAFNAFGGAGPPPVHSGFHSGFGAPPSFSSNGHPFGGAGMFGSPQGFAPQSFQSAPQHGFVGAPANFGSSFPAGGGGYQPYRMPPLPPVVPAHRPMHSFAPPHHEPRFPHVSYPPVQHQAPLHQQYQQQPHGQFSAAQGGNTKVYINNLTYDTTWYELKDHLRLAGGAVLKADVLMDREGRSKGCGIAEFASARDALDAIARLNESDLKGRKIFLREDREAAGHEQHHHQHQHHQQHSSSFGAQRSRSNSLQSARTVDSAEDSASAVDSANDNDSAADSSSQKGGGEEGNRFVYVGGLPYETQWPQVKDHLKLAGHVLKVDVVTDDAGRSKGFAVAEFATAEDAARAVATLNKSQLEGRTITLREDRDHSGTSGRQVHGQLSHPRAAGSSSGYRLYVGNLAWEVRWTHLKDLFKTKGFVARADVLMETRPDGTERSRGFGFVEYPSQEDAERAIRELNDFVLMDRKIFVREDRDAPKPVQQEY